MKEHQSLSHTTWECKYKVVFITKCRKRLIFRVLRRELARCFKNWRGTRNRR
jgi:REP-associated tyrosine transposase